MKKKLFLCALAASMLLSGCAGKSENTDTAAAAAQTTSAASPEAPASENDSDTKSPAVSDDPGKDINDPSLTSLEAIRLMGNGINLGNTLEAYAHKRYLSGADPDGFETSWGQPYTTPEMFEDMKELGFDTVRIPVAWTNGMNYESGDYTIDERLMTRVETVVNYALDADLFVIINDHWDGSWWGMFGSPDESVREQGMELYKSMWTQIGERFKDHSYKLIFESANEELGDRLNDSDVTGTKGVLSKSECYEKLYEINSEFVKLIRSLGGKNSDRFLLIAGYNTDITNTCDDRYKMPEDTAKDKLMLSVHYYTPWDYCGTDAVDQWGSPTDYKEQNGLFEMLSKFSKQGYGIVIGEYAVMRSDGKIKPDTDKFYDNLLDNCDLYDCCPVLWDCSNFYKRKSRMTSDAALADLFDARRYDNEKDKTADEVKAAAKRRLEETYRLCEENFVADVDFMPSDDMAIAWIMYSSGDWSKSYSVGDTYDPTNRTAGLNASNAEITGEGTYTVSLDFSGCGAASGVSFSALGISNGEKFFPGYIISIDEVRVNGEPYPLAGKEYTCSDDGKCTRVNLYNEWVSTPGDGRTTGAELSECSPVIMPLNGIMVKKLEITFSFIAP